MSNVIDDKVVRIRFDSSDFEKNVESSKSKLQAFENVLSNLGKSNTKSFDDINNSAENLNKNGLTKLQDSVDTLSEKFSAWGVIGKRVLEDLTDQAVKAGEQLIKSLTVDQIAEGWNKYQAQVSGVQKMISTLSTAFPDATDEQIEQHINKYIAKLQYFSDETSYSTSQMVNVMSTMVATGTKDLEKATTTIEGMAMAFAQAGVSISNSEGAFVSASKIISSGRMMTKQFDQLMTTYHAIDSNFLTTLADTAVEYGTVTKVADGYYKTVAKGETFAASEMRTVIDQGIITADVFTAAMAKYGEVADRIYSINQEQGGLASSILKQIADDYDSIYIHAYEAAQTCKSFTDVIEATQDAVSTQFGKIWASIFGGYNDAKNLWSELCEYFYDTFIPVWKQVAKVFEVWNEYGGRDLLFGLEEVDEATGEITKEQGALWDILDAVNCTVWSIYKGLAEIFPLFKALIHDEGVGQDAEDYKATLDAMYEQLALLEEDTEEYKALNEQITEFKENTKTSWAEDIRYVAAWLKVVCQRFKEWTETIRPTDEQLENIKDMVSGIGAAIKFISYIIRIVIRVALTLFRELNVAIQPIFLFFKWLLAKLMIFENGKLPGILGTATKKVAELAEKLRQLFESVVAIVIFVMDYVFDIFDNIWDDGNALNNIIDFAINVILPALIWCLEKIVTLLNLIANSGLAKKIGAIFKDIGNFITSGIIGVCNAIASIDIATLTDALKGVLDILWGLATWAFDWFLEKLANVNWVRVAFRIMAIMSAVLPAVIVGFAGWTDVVLTKAWTGLLNNISGFISSLKDAIDAPLQAMKRDGTIKLLKTFARALVEVAIACGILALLPWSKVLAATGALAALATVLIIATSAITKVASGIEGVKWKTLIGKAGGIASVATIIQTLSSAMLKMAIGLALVTAVTDKTGIKPMLAAAGAMTVMLGVVAGLVTVIIANSKTFLRSKNAQPALLAISNAIKTISGCFFKIALSLALVVGITKAVGADAIDVMTAGMTVTGMLIAASIILIAAYDVTQKMKISNTNNFMKRLITLTACITTMSVAFPIIGAAIRIVARGIKEYDLSYGMLAEIAGILSFLLMTCAGIILIALYVMKKTGTVRISKMAAFTGALMIVAASMVVIAFAVSMLGMVMDEIGANALWQSVAMIAILTAAATAVLDGGILLMSYNKTATRGELATFTGVFVSIAASMLIMAKAVCNLGRYYNELGSETAWAALAIVSLMTTLISGVITAVMELGGRIMNAASTIASFGGAFLAIAIGLIIITQGIKQIADLVKEQDSVNGLWAAVAVMSVLVLVMSAIVGGLGILGNYFPLLIPIMAILVPLVLAFAAATKIMVPALIEAVKGFVDMGESVDWDKMGDWLGPFTKFCIALFFVSGIMSLTAPALLLASLGFAIFNLAVQDSLLPMFTSLQKVDWEKVGEMSGNLFGFAFSLFFIAGLLSLAAPALLIAGGALAVFNIVVQNCLVPMLTSLMTFDWEKMGSVVGALWLMALNIAGITLILTVLSIPILIASGVLAVLSSVIPDLLNALGALKDFEWDQLWENLGDIWRMIGLISAVSAILGLVGLVSAPGLIAFGAALTAIGIGLATIILPLGLFFKLMENVTTEKAQEVYDAIILIGKAFVDSIKTLVEAVPELANDFYKATVAVVTSYCKAIQKTAPVIANTILAVIGEVLNLIAKSSGDITEAVGALTYEVLDATLTVLDRYALPLSEHMMKTTIKILQGWADLLEQYGPDLKKAFKDFANEFSDLVQDKDVQEAFEKIIDSFNYLTDKAYDLGKIIGEAIGNGILGAIDGFMGSIPAKIGEAVGMSKEGAIQFAKDACIPIVGPMFALAKYIAGAYGDGGSEIDPSLTPYSSDDIISDAENKYHFDGEIGNYVSGTTASMTYNIWDMDKRMSAHYYVEGEWVNYEQAVARCSKYGGDLAKAIDAGFIKYMEIKSPSRRMMRNAKYVVAGLTNGLSNGNSDIADAAISNGEAYINAYKKRMKIHSPSKETAKVGKNTSEGVAEGVKEGNASVAEAAEETGTTYENAVSSAFERIRAKFSEFVSILKDLGVKMWNVVKSAFGFGDKYEQEGGGLQGWIADTFGLEKDENGNVDLMATIQKSLGLGDGESLNDILAGFLGDDFDAEKILGESTLGATGDFTIDEDLADSTTGTGTGSASTSSSTSSKSNGRNNYSYNIVQNNYSPTALNTTAIYRNTKSTFSRLEGANVIK